VPVDAQRRGRDCRELTCAPEAFNQTLSPTHVVVQRSRAPSASNIRLACFSSLSLCQLASSP
jgi:hypothetical protein